MPLKSVSFREVRRKLIAAGFVEASQKGSHMKFVKQTENSVFTAIVPRHRDVAIGTLKSILRQAGITEDEFENL